MNTTFENLLGYDAVSVGKYLQTFSRIRGLSLSMSSGHKKALKSFETLGTSHPAVQYHFPEV
jgi:hypothetical protein